MNEFKNNNNLKVKNCSGTLSSGCLALEGGAFRGIYTAGVLDYFLEHNLFFDTAYGVSAGALTACNYMAGAFGRSAYLMLSERYNKDYVGIRPALEQGSVIGFDFIFDEMEKKYPINEKELFRQDKTLNIVACNVKSGKAEYFSNHNEKDVFYKALRASASIPIVSKMVNIYDNYYLDGGVATKIPIRAALNEGHKKIVFVGTRDASYRRKPNSTEIDIAKVVYSDYPEFIETFSKANENYNKDCDLIDQLVKEKKIFRITPSKPVEVSRLEGNLEKLSDLYYLGYFDAMNCFDKLIKYLNSPNCQTNRNSVL
ncbi:MAG: patatin family protein [Erysipelotrichaceae bacterium]|nr:patatin family protein [Erysipelotrichaceae bacterium]